MPGCCSHPMVRPSMPQVHDMRLPYCISTELDRNSPLVQATASCTSGRPPLCFGGSHNRGHSSTLVQSEQSTPLQ